MPNVSKFTQAAPTDLLYVSPNKRYYLVKYSDRGMALGGSPCDLAKLPQKLRDEGMYLTNLRSYPYVGYVYSGKKYKQVVEMMRKLK